MASAGGGLLNIVSEGANNALLNDNDLTPPCPENNYKPMPKCFFTDKSYRKYTNFGKQKFRIDYTGQRILRLTEPSKFTFKIGRDADLLNDAFLSINLPNIWSPIYGPLPINGDSEDLSNWAPYDFRWIKDIGFQMITEVEITIGNATIAKFSGAYLSAVVQRDFPAERQALVNEMTGNTADLNDPANAFGRINSYPSAYYTTADTGANPSIRARELLIPINSFFSLIDECAFPLVCLQLSELYINITLRPIQELFQVRDVFDSANNYPYIQPDFNTAEFAMYRFLQTPPAVNIDPVAYQTTITNWAADIHLIVTETFLTDPERSKLVLNPQAFILRDVYTYSFYGLVGSGKVKLESTPGLVHNWMFFFQRNDVNMRNEWANYSNWPYEALPANIQIAPAEDSNSPYPDNLGPLINPDGTNTGIFITGIFNTDNHREVLETMAIQCDGTYRESTMVRGIYDYLEKYAGSKGNAKQGLYCYNFCVYTDPTIYQPSGGLNTAKFRTIQFEFTTYVPPVNTTNSMAGVICDPSGNPIGYQSKPAWMLYDYNYNLTIFEERFNVLTIVNGEASLLYAR